MVGNQALVRLASDRRLVIRFIAQGRCSPPVNDSGSWMLVRPAVLAAILSFSTLVPVGIHAEEIDTEHLFGFMIGTDIGSIGEREFQSQTTGRFSKAGGDYRAVNQEFELELVPVDNFRIELGSS